MVRGEVDAFERGWRAFGIFRLAKCQIVRRIAVDDDVRAERVRERVVTTEPIDHRAFGQLHRSVANGSPYGFKADFGSARWADAPSHHSFVVGWNEEPPTWHEPRPWGDFDRGAVMDIFERVMYLPPIARLRFVVRDCTVCMQMFGRRAVVLVMRLVRIVVIRQHQLARALLRRLASRLFLREDWLR